MRAGASPDGLVWLTSVVLALGGARAGAQDPAPTPRASVFCVVHCDPVPPPAFEQNFALLEQLVAAADATGHRLSIHWTGSYAALARQAGKAATVRAWAERGHGMGLHAHPEDVGPDGRWLPQVAWTAFPQERVEETLARATDEVNQLVGAERNVVLDTLLPFYSSPARFPAQYTHFAWGNNGHGRPAPIVLPGGRTLTAVFYRTLPGDPAVDALRVPAARLLDELAASEVAYGPVLHPADFQGATRRELVAFFEGTRARGHAATRVADVTAPRGRDEAGLRLSCAVADARGDARVVAVRVENQGRDPVSGLTLTVYLPADYPRLDAERARPLPSTHDAARQRQAVTYAGQAYAPGTTTTYLLPLSRAERLVGHPISAVVDAHLEGAGVTARWSFLTLAGTPAEGWYLPFESFAPEGAATTSARRVAAVPPRLDRDLAERLRRDVADRPTDASTLRDRLRLAVNLARSLLQAGRQAELDRVLPPARLQRIETDARAGKVTEAAADLDRALLGLADLAAAAPDRPPPR